ncbi:MAG: glycosyltransferase involved in cell wall biosynthesis [Sphingobacteriales bacterium]
MVIAVNTRLLLKNKLQGIGWFSYESLKRITQDHPEHTFHFFFDRPFDQEFVFGENVIPHVLFPQARHPFLYFLFFEFAVTQALKTIKADLFLSPDGYLSLRTDVPSIQVIHDLNFEHNPEFVPFFERKFYRYFFPRYARKAARIATVSSFSKQDIIDVYGIAENKIDVVYNGAGKQFQPLSDIEQVEIRNEISGGVPYFLYVGAFHHRKNMHGMVNAFSKFKRLTQSKVKFVFVGEKLFGDPAFAKAYETCEFKNDFIFTGRLASEKLPKVIASAQTMVYVPFFEGFGIPPLEAMQSGTPVICSNVSSLPEVVGNAALTVNPKDCDEIVSALSRMDSDPELRENFKRLGLEQAKKFSWEKTARALYNSIEKVLNG